jgi:anti-sigma regulatory factor (Ser/Thr protein kinase)/anti-anti-sigma regulatory factor
MPTNISDSLMIKPPTEISEEATRAFLKLIDKALKKGLDDIVLDCSNLTQVTSSHINAMWQAWKNCEEAGRKIRLYRPSSGLIKVLQVLDLYELFVDQPIDTNFGDSTKSRSETQIGEKSFRSNFPATPEEIKKAQINFDSFLDSINLNKITAFELSTVFYEVATNVLTHGQLGKRDLIEFSATYSRHRLIMTFIDPGQPFNMPVKTPDFDPTKAMVGRKTHGFGLIMIGRLTDEISYERKQGKFNVLTLKKEWR